MEITAIYFIRAQSVSYFLTEIKIKLNLGGGGENPDIMQTPCDLINAFSESCKNCGSNQTLNPGDTVTLFLPSRKSSLKYCKSYLIAVKSKSSLKS